MQGDLSANVDLKDLAGEKHLYALGALEGLRGEVLILDGHPFISHVVEGSVVMDTSFDHRASLLVRTPVRNWKPALLSDSPLSYKELEARIAQMAADSSITEPFPFLLRGPVDSLSWHIIDWPEGDTVHTHEKHREAGIRGTLAGAEVEILGFYSTSHHGIISHHTTDMHLHVRTADGRVAAHVDDVKTGGGMKILLRDED